MSMTEPSASRKPVPPMSYGIAGWGCRRSIHFRQNKLQTVSLHCLAWGFGLADSHLHTVKLHKRQNKLISKAGLHPVSVTKWRNLDVCLLRLYYMLQGHCLVQFDKQRFCGISNGRLRQFRPPSNSISLVPLIPLLGFVSHYAGTVRRESAPSLSKSALPDMLLEL